MGNAPQNQTNEKSKSSVTYKNLVEVIIDNTQQIITMSRKSIGENRAETFKKAVPKASLEVHVSQCELKQL